MKAGDFDLGQKMKVLNFLIWYDESTEGKFVLYVKSGFKVKRWRKKSVKSRRKNFKFFFMHFYLGVRNVINKKACLMLIFLNLKSLGRHLFWGVASSLSILCSKCFSTLGFLHIASYCFLLLPSVMKYFQVLPLSTWNHFEGLGRPWKY